MTVKLLLLKSGEEIISDVKEMVIGEDPDISRTVGYYLKNPCTVKINESSLVSDSSETIGKFGYEVSLYKWIPLSEDDQISIPIDWVVTMTNPVSKLKDMYMEDVIKNGEKHDKNISTDEQSDSNQSD